MKPRSYKDGLVIDDRTGVRPFWIRRDEETGAGYFVTREELGELHEAIGEAIKKHDAGVAAMMRARGKATEVAA